MPLCRSCSPQLALLLGLTAASCTADDVDDLSTAAPDAGTQVVPVDPLPFVPAPEILADGLVAPRLLDGDRTALVFVEGAPGAARIVLVNRLDGTSLEIAGTAEVQAPGALVLTPTWVAWTEPADGTVRRARRDGGLVESLIKDLYQPSSITADGDRLFVGLPDGAVFTLPPEGGEPTKLAVLPGGTKELRADDAAVYALLDTGEIWRLPRNGEDAELLATDNAAAHALTVHGSSLFWLTGNGSVRSVDLVSRQLQFMTTAGGHPSDLGVDDAFLWVSDPERGVIVKLPRAGGAAMVLDGLAGPSEIVAGTYFVAWLDTDGGALLSLAK
jgi:hypothetical protein